MWFRMSLLHCCEQFVLQVAPEFFKNGSVGDADFKNPAAKTSNMTSGGHTFTSRRFPDLVEFLTGRLLGQSFRSHDALQQMSQSRWLFVVAHQTPMPVYRELTLRV